MHPNSQAFLYVSNFVNNLGYGTLNVLICYYRIKRFLFCGGLLEGELSAAYNRYTVQYGVVNKIIFLFFLRFAALGLALSCHNLCGSLQPAI